MMLRYCISMVMVTAALIAGAGDCGRSLFRQGQYMAAYEAYSTWLADHPFALDRPTVVAAEADALFAAGDYTRARSIYIAIDPRTVDSTTAALVALRRGICAFQLGLPSDAETDFEDAMADSYTRSAAAFYLGRICYSRGEFARAKGYFQAVNPSEAPGDMAAFYLADISLAEGDYGKALSAARLLARNSDLAPELHAELDRITGQALYHQGERRQAIEHIDRYLGTTSSPDNASLYIAGLDRFEQGRYADALTLLRPVADSGTGTMQQSAYLYIGQCLVEEGDTQAAILAFDRAAQMDADAAVREAAFYNYAAAKYAGAEVPFASAAETFEEFLSLYPSGPYSDRVAAYLATGYMADKDYARALQRIDAIEVPSPSMLRARQRVLYMLGLEALRQNDITDARKHLEEAMKYGKYDADLNAEAELAYAQTLLTQGHYGDAAARYRHFLATAPKSTTNRGVAYYGLAYAYYRLRNGDKAAENFRQAISRSNDATLRADAYNRLADICFARADFAGAADLYAQAYEAAPAAGDYAALNGARMRGYMRDYQGKIQQIETFTESFPSSPLMPEALLELTQAQISLGRNEDALATYRSLIDRYPLTSQGRRGYLQMAMTLLDMGHTDEAADTYRQVIRLYPTSEEAAQASSLLQTLYADRGRADEYLSFITSVDRAPKISPDEAEQLSYDSAIKALKERSETRQIEKYLADYPSGPRTPAALEALLQHLATADPDRADEYAAILSERFPDSRQACTALEYQATRARQRDDLDAALTYWQRLAEKSSDAATATRANVGIMRTARDMGRMTEAATAAEAILASTAAGSAATEATYTRGVAMEADGRTDEAIDTWLSVATATSDVYGAKSAFEAADALLESGRTDKALETAQQLVKSGSPHRYWVARGFILISDIYKKKGKNLEAREYLEALHDNYPGRESDIFLMIDSRLDQLK